MKVTKLRVLLMLLLAVGVVFTGCGDDGGDTEQMLEPTIVFNNTGGALTANDSVEVGTSINLAVVLTKGNDGKKLKTVRFTANTADGGGFEAVNHSLTSFNLTGSDLTTYNSTGNVGVNADTYNFTLTNYNRTTAGSVTFRVYVEDNDGNSASRDITVTWTTAVIVPTAPLSFTSTVNSTNNVFSVRSQLVGTGSSVNTTDQPNYDFLYFNSGSTGPNFVSADQASNTLLSTFALSNFTSGAATRIRTSTLTAADFNAINDQTVLEARYNSASDQTITGWNSASPPAPAGSRVNQDTNIAAGKVLAFSAPGGKFGLILIETASASSITFKVKVVN